MFENTPRERWLQRFEAVFVWIPQIAWGFLRLGMRRLLNLLRGLLLLLTVSCTPSPEKPTPQPVPEQRSAPVVVEQPPAPLPLPEGAEERALQLLTPSQEKRGLPDNFDWDLFTYDRHECHDYKGTHVVCTACYEHPKHYMGQFSVKCPLKASEPCELLLYGGEPFFTEHGVDLAYCETHSSVGDP